MRRSLFGAVVCALACLYSCGTGQTEPDDDLGTAVDDMEEADLAMASDMPPDLDQRDSAEDADMVREASCEGDACVYSPAFAYDNIREIEGFEIPSQFQDRKLPMLVRFPEGATEPLPVVVWAHGGSWSTNGHKLNAAWSRRIAAAGYAVLHFAVTPPDETLLPEICQRAGLADPSRCEDLSLANVDTELEDPADNPFFAITVVRPADGASVLDALPTIATRLEDRAGVTLDTSRVIVAGWSGGSQVVLQMAGATRIAEASTPPYADPDERPIAFVALSPQGPGFSNFYADDEGTSWDNITRPTMVITGVGDEKPGNDLTGPDRYAVYTHLPPGQKRLFYSTSESAAIRHSTFNLADIEASDADAAAVSRALVSAMLANLDAQARDSDAARAWLESDAAIELSGGELDWGSK